MTKPDPNALKLLVVDDDPALLTVLEAGLGMLPGVAVTAVVRASEAMTLLRREAFDVLVSDYSLDDPNVSGLTLLGMAQQQPNKPLTIIITAYASLQISLQSIELGAYDFLTKPFQMEELQLVVRNASELLKTRRENLVLMNELRDLRETLEKIERDQGVISERMKLFAGGYESAGTDPGLPALTNGLDGPAVQELRRRRMREQVQGYQRMSETLGEQLTRQRQRIESLVEVGLIPQDALQRAVREGRFAPRPDPKPDTADTKR